MLWNIFICDVILADIGRLIFVQGTGMITQNLILKCIMMFMIIKVDVMCT